MDKFSAFFDRGTASRVQPQTIVCQIVSQVSYRVIAYYRFFFCVLQLEWAQSYREIFWQPNYQISSVTPLVCLTLQRSVDVTQNSLAYILKIIGAETEAALEILL